MGWRGTRRCAVELQDARPPSPPCSGVRRHGEVLQPAAIVNHCKGAKTGCYGASIPPETQGRLDGSDFIIWKDPTTLP
ncbi:hypothetical protein NQZ68_020354 [Dissostichus eleginoides]|nr:hypothetical protein NQZ68_020354 [Dissostichus eleginoides]